MVYEDMTEKLVQHWYGHGGLVLSRFNNMTSVFVLSFVCFIPPISILI